MPKELKQKKEAKKKPTMTAKEKKAAKRSKKEGKLAGLDQGIGHLASMNPQQHAQRTHHKG